MPDITVAVLGTGIMGLPMAGSMLNAGLRVRAWNRTTEKTQPLAERGAEATDTPEQAVSGADIVVTMLADGPAVADVMADALSSVPSGALWLQMSTVGVDWTDRLASIARDNGIAFVDAPVLGTRGPAEQGELVVFAAGPEEERQRCAPVFDAVGSRTMWVGPVGAASRLKLVANTWVLALTNATAESVALAEALGIDPALFLEAITGGSLDVPYAHLKGGAMIHKEFPLSFSTVHAAKDARLVLEAADGTVDLGATRATLTHLEKAIDEGHGDEDMATVYYGCLR